MMFKRFLGGSLAILMFIGCTTLTVSAQPVNDDCAAAIPVGENSATPWTTLMATNSVGLTCTVTSDIWFEVTPSADGVLTVALNNLVNVAGSGTDSNHAVYCNPGGGLCPVNADIVSCILPASGVASVTGGHSYLIRVGSAVAANQFTGTLDLSFVPVPAPVNDDCSAAITVTENSSTPWSTLGATNSCGLTCRGGSDIWYEVTPSASGALTVALTGLTNAVGSGVDTFHSVYTNPGGGLCPLDAGQLLCSDPPSGQVSVLGSQSYLIRVGAWSSTAVVQFNGTLNLSLVTPATNDDCANAISVSVSPGVTTNTQWTTLGATNSVGLSCVASTDVWFEVTPPASGSLQMVLSGVSNVGGATGTTVRHALYQNPGGGLCPVDADLVSACFTATSGGGAPVIGGQSYLYRIGSSTTSQLLGTSSLTLHLPAPNDDCANAISLPIVAGVTTTTSWSTVSATNSVGLTCAASTDVWYELTPPESGQLSMALAGVTNVGGATGTTVRHALYQNPGGGGLCPVDADLVSTCFTVTGGGTAAVIGGQSYLYRIGSSTTSQLTGTANLTLSVPPLNETCLTALPAMLGANPYDNTLAVTDPLPITPVTGCIGSGTGTSGGHRDVWFSYLATDSCPLEIHTCLGTKDTILYLFEDDCSTFIDCSDDACPISPGGSGFASRIVHGATAGQTLLIRVSSWGTTAGSSVGPGTLFIQPFAPGNDNCLGAIPLTLGDTAFCTTPATTDGVSLAGFCDPGPFGDDQIHRDIWYTFSVACSGTYRLSTCNQADFDTRLAVYSSTACPEDPATAIACNDDGTGCSLFTSELTFAATAGQSLLIRVGGFSAADAGAGTLTLERIGNDNCETPQVIGLGDTPYDIDLCVTTDGPAVDIPTCTTWFGTNAQVNKDLWYLYSATDTGTLTIGSCLATITGAADSRMAVYLGSVCPTDNTNLLGCDDDGCFVPDPNPEFRSELSVHVDAGNDYLIRWGLFSTSATAVASGTINLSFVSDCNAADVLTLDADVDNGNAPHTVVLTATASGTGPLTWAWDSGDGQVSSDPDTATFTYLTPGIYTASVTVTNACGSDTLDVVITVCDPIAASISSSGSTGLAPWCVTLTSTSTGDIATLDWDSGAGDSDSGPAASFTYNAPGIYTATLTVTGTCGRVEMATESVFAYANGDCNADWSIGIADPIFLAAYLFSGGATPSCPNACDSNGDGNLNLGDVVYSLSHLFSGGPIPVVPAPCTPCL